uniref:Uncharacterized protein n=1 Tax=Anguilla anguilla TaxID=7936 RepID=A0A0E9R1Y7_ANGAN
MFKHVDYFTCKCKFAKKKGKVSWLCDSFLHTLKIFRSSLQVFAVTSLANAFLHGDYCETFSPITKAR